MRGLATDLGVTPMALYWHFANRDELLHAVGDTLAAALPTPAPADSQTWDQRFETLVRTLIAHLGTHPQAAEVMMTRLLFTPAGRTFAEAALTALQAAGLDGARSLAVGRHTLRVAVGVATESVFAGAGDESGRRTGADEEFAAQAAALPRDEFPLLLGLTASLQSASDAVEYRETAIRVLVAGVGALAAASPSDTA
jgi:AcrR family transcriptional regulator